MGNVPFVPFYVVPALAFPVQLEVVIFFMLLALIWIQRRGMRRFNFTNLMLRKFNPDTMSYAYLEHKIGIKPNRARRADPTDAVQFAADVFHDKWDKLPDAERVSELD